MSEATVSAVSYCSRCGTATGDHSDCLRQLQLEPPRFCADCGRRLIVQVTPGGWTARCSQHGDRTS